MTDRKLCEQVGKGCLRSAYVRAPVSIVVVSRLVRLTNSFNQILAPCLRLATQCLARTCVQINADKVCEGGTRKETTENASVTGLALQPGCQRAISCRLWTAYQAKGNRSLSDRSPSWACYNLWLPRIFWKSVELEDAILQTNDELPNGSSRSVRPARCRKRACCCPCTCMHRSVCLYRWVAMSKYTNTHLWTHLFAWKLSC